MQNLGTVRVMQSAARYSVPSLAISCQRHSVFRLSVRPWSYAKVCERISYKPRMGISPNLQLGGVLDRDEVIRV